jgi:hypothetical protein
MAAPSSSKQMSKFESTCCIASQPLWQITKQLRNMLRQSSRRVLYARYVGPGARRRGLFKSTSGAMTRRGCPNSAMLLAVSPRLTSKTKVAGKLTRSGSMGVSCRYIALSKAAKTHSTRSCFPIGTHSNSTLADMESRERMPPTAFQRGQERTNGYPWAARSQDAGGGVRITRGEITASTSTTGISCGKALQRNTCLPKERTASIRIEALEIHYYLALCFISKQSNGRPEWGTMSISISAEQSDRFISVTNPFRNYSSESCTHNLVIAR